MWVTPSHIKCLVFRVFSGETLGGSSAGVAALEFTPGALVHTLAHPLPPASPAEMFEETKVSLSTSRRVFPSRKTHGKLRTNRKTGGITMRRAISILSICLLIFATTPGFATSGAHFMSSSASVNGSGALVVSWDEAGLGNGNINY